MKFCDIPYKEVCKISSDMCHEICEKVFSDILAELGYVQTSAQISQSAQSLQIAQLQNLNCALPDFFCLRNLRLCFSYIFFWLRNLHTRF